MTQFIPNLKKFNNSVNRSLLYKNNESLSKEVEYQLISNWQKNKDEKSLNKLLAAYQKLVNSILRKYLSYGISQEDLFQEGMIGLVYAIDKFDVSRGFRLSTYSRWWIKAVIQNYILKNWSVVKTGSTASQKTLFFGFNKLKKQINFNSLNFMGEEELKKISNILGMKSFEIQNMESRLTMGDQSLNQKISEDDQGDLMSLLEDDSLTPDIIAEKNNDNKLKKKWLDEAINKLNDREKIIIFSRKKNDNAKTLHEIGKKLNISKERVRQIEVGALKKLKKIILQTSNESEEFFLN